MSLLVACPVILPPRDDVLAGWDHRPMYVAINGASEEWHPAVDRLSESGRVYSSDPARNIGVAASWNKMFDAARALGLSHVALISQGVVLDGGTARLAALVEEHADWRGMLTDFAWRVIVLSVKLWEQVGPFDERFFPAYFEDSDYTRRLFLAGLHAPGNPMPKVERDILDGTATEAGALNAGLIDPAWYGHNGDLYQDKWGGSPFRETFDRPDDRSSKNPTNNWSHADRPHDEGARHAH